MGTTIQRYSMRIAPFGKGLQCRKMADANGAYVLYADHLATVRALAAKIRENLFEPDKILCVIDAALQSSAAGEEKDDAIKQS